MLLTIPEKTRATFKIPDVLDISATFPTNTNRPPWAKRTPGDIRHLVIHHSASTGTLEAENRYHIHNNNWYKISYHLSIDKGRIVQLNGLLDRTSHAMGANDTGIGICVNWDLRLRGLTEFEQNALNGVVITLQEMFPNAEIVGHNEISLKLANHRTSCPIISMSKLRETIMTEGLKLELTETPNDKLAQSVAVRTRIEDLYLTSQKVGKYQDEAYRKLIRIGEIMKAEGLM